MEKVILSLADLAGICQAQREAGETIVLTSGCFDLLHGGHLEYICSAGAMGYLVVGINGDAFVKRLKGDNRPIRGQDDRAFTMAGFFPVRLVSIFDCDYELISAVLPNIYVASATSRVRVWADTLRVSILNQIGARIVEMQSIKEESTTSIIQRAANA